MSVTRPIFYILTGLSFAGKSVLARDIRSERGLDIIDPDAVGHEMGLGLHGEFVSDAHWSTIHAEAERRAARLLEQGRDVVYDTTSFTRPQRDALRALADAHGATPIVIYVSISCDQAWLRWEENNETRERFLIHPDDFAMVADHFEPPGRDESSLVYQAGEDRRVWIDRHIPPKLA
jgi:predicted kinase